jgi:hypothetical protein
MRQFRHRERRRSGLLTTSVDCWITARNLTSKVVADGCGDRLVFSASYYFNFTGDLLVAGFSFTTFSRSTPKAETRRAIGQHSFSFPSYDTFQIHSRGASLFSDLISL